MEATNSDSGMAKRPREEDGCPEPKRMRGENDMQQSIQHLHDNYGKEETRKRQHQIKIISYIDEKAKPKPIKRRISTTKVVSKPKLQCSLQKAAAETKAVVAPTTKQHPEVDLKLAIEHLRSNYNKENEKRDAHRLKATAYIPIVELPARHFSSRPQAKAR